MARLETWYKQDLKKPLIVHKHSDVFNQDNRGNLIGVEVYSNGDPVTLAGSISGYCLLADGTTVPAVGASRSGNKASVLIPQTAYGVPGPITITIKNVEGNDITTLCAVVGLVRQSVSGNLVNPGSVVTDWSNSINAQLQAVQTAADNVGAIVAAPFDENTVYVVGNYVTNNGNLYRITGDHASGVAWADTTKVQCTVGSELFDLKSAISNLVGDYTIPSLVLGNITIAADGTPTYQTNRYYGAITPNGSDAHFEAGQVVRLKSYELTQGVALKYFVALNNGEGKYPTGSGWMQSDYTIPETGDYCINIQTVPTTNQESVSVFDGFFEVIDQTARIPKIEKELSEVIDSEAETSQSVDALSESIGFVGYSIPELRLGNIVIAADGTPTYQVRDYGVITPSGSYCVFQTGTKLSLSDYSGAQFAVGLNLGNGKVSNPGWITSGYYTIQQSGEYILNIQSKPTTSQSSIDALYSLFTVEASTLSERMTNAENEIIDLQPELFSLNGIKSVKTINNFWPQGVALVGNNVLMCYASNDAHTNHANITIYNINDLETQIGYIEHNTGHCASADYSEEKDLLLIANGNYPAPTPTVYLVHDFANKLAQRDNIEYNGADVTALVLSSVTSQAVCGCFGETGDILYVVTCADNYDVDFTKTIYQLQIGFGANDMVTKFPSASVGTYQAASDGVPNGTAHIIATYTVQFPGELQGLKYLNNRLIVPCDSRIPNGVKTPYLVSVQFTKSGAKVTNTYWIPAVNADGTRPAVETEDVLFDGVYGYAEANGKIFKFPIMIM